MIGRVIYLHGMGATSWKFAFAESLKADLESLGFETVFETLPDSIMAREQYWMRYLNEIAKVTEDDVLIGWSSGAVAAMRYAESNKIRGSILISPSYTDLGDEAERASGYFNRPWDWAKIQENQNQIALVYGDDDPCIPQEEFEHISGRLRPEVHKIPQGKHFIQYSDFKLISELVQKFFRNCP